MLVEYERRNKTRPVWRTAGTLIGYADHGYSESAQLANMSVSIGGDVALSSVRIWVSVNDCGEGRLSVEMRPVPARLTGVTSDQMSDVWTGPTFTIADDDASLTLPKDGWLLTSLEQRDTSLVSLTFCGKVDGVLPWPVGRRVAAKAQP